MRIEVLFTVASWRWGGVFLVTLRGQKSASPSSEVIITSVRNCVERLKERNIFPQAQRAGGREKYIVVVREINGEPVEPLILTDFIVTRTPTAAAPKRRLMC